MLTLAKPETIKTIMGSHYAHNVSGPLDMDVFNNLTYNMNHHVPPSVATDNMTTTSMGTAGDGRNLVVVGILIALIVLLCLFLALVAIPPMYAIWRSSLPVNPKKVERRYRTIEGWLISKKVHEHDDHCDEARRAYADKCEHQQQRPEPQETPPPIEQCHSTDETVDSNSSPPCCVVESACETPKGKGESPKEVDIMVSTSSEEHECPICMEPFLAGQTASWSASDSCEHVFHHSCIKEWLLRHIHCPCCREIYLLVDCPQNKKFTPEDLQQLASERKRRYDQTYFCAKEGLVTLHGLPPSPFKSNKNSEIYRDDLLMTVKSKTKSGVSKNLLATMRSTPALGGESSSSSESPTSLTASSVAVETQQPTSSSSLSPFNTSISASFEPRMSSHATSLAVLFVNVPFDEVPASATNDSPESTPKSENESTMTPMSVSLTVPINSPRCSRLEKSIWRGVDDGPEVPSTSMPLSKSIIGDEFDVEEGQDVQVVTQTDSFKENQTESSRGKNNAITLIMGATRGHHRKSELAKPKVSVAQPFLSENYQNI